MLIWSFIPALSNTVTAGVVSSIQRPSQELGLRGRDINYIQTDAAITFGNSGGPLVNLDGEAIGINSMKVTAGISFAIPIDYARNFLKQAEAKVKKGKSSAEPTNNRRYMGITMLSLTPEIIAELKQRGSPIPEAIVNGILVWKVIMGSPAHTSGLMAGDIILNINGTDVRLSGDIYEILASRTKVLNMIVLRNGQLVKLSVVPDDPEWITKSHFWKMCWLTTSALIHYNWRVNWHANEKRRENDDKKIKFKVFVIKLTTSSWSI